MGRARPAPAPSAAAAAAGPTIAGCPVFPKDNAWNRDISRAPVDPRSADYLRSIGLGRRVHPDFGSGRYGDYGIPITIAAAGEPKRGVHFTDYGDESDKGPYPVPAGARVEGGDDRHVLVVQRGGCKLTSCSPRGEPAAAGRPRAERSSTCAVRASAPPAGRRPTPPACRSCPGSRAPTRPRAGRIRHALRFTAPRTQRAYVAPARHAAGASSDRALPPMGLRLRLKASLLLKGYRGQSLAILRALQDLRDDPRRQRLAVLHQRRR